MKENLVTIRSGNLSLEGLYAQNGGAGAALCLHPHPMMGGTMHDPVTAAVVSAFFSAGYSTLRFNFRGVGGSGGRYDDGRGEQQDVVAARGFLQGDGKCGIALAGYSFGAWVCANLLEKDSCFSDVVFVSPPLDFMVFPAYFPKVHLITYGSEDPFCSAGSIRHYAKYCGSRIECITGADHFYSGKISHLANIIEEFLLLRKSMPL